MGRKFTLPNYFWYLYHNMTEPERALESAIAALGRRYRPQHPFPGIKHFADYALLDDKLIIEVDGSSHEKPAQIKKDLQHMIRLKVLGWDVYRVSNERAKFDPEGVVFDALNSSRTSLEELEAALARHLRNYPSLSDERAKPPKSSKPAPPKKGADSKSRKRPAQSRAQSS